MARPLAISLYLGLHKSKDNGGPFSDYPDRPDGTVIWAICSTRDDARRIAVLETALRADGDVISIFATHATSDPSHPTTQRATAQFIKHVRPDLALWAGAPLDPITLDALATAGIPSIAIEATRAITTKTDASRIPALTRTVLGYMSRIITLDQPSADAFLRSGAEPEQVIAMGPIEETPQPLNYNEAERQDLAAALGTRPIWLAAGARLSETDLLVTAHKKASRRAHRLLLIIATEDPEEAAPLAQALSHAGFETATRADDGEPSETTQIFVADGTEELGLWYRIAPVTFMSGTLSTGARRHPFEPAALGSAVLHGGEVAPYVQQFAQLTGSGGALNVTSAAALGDAVETLLSADKVAKMAHAAWDVTTQGADVAQQMAALIQAQLDQAEAARHA